MELSHQEQRMIERLRKQERQWHWARWAALASGILSAGLCGFILCFILPRVQSGTDMAGAAFGLALMFPMVLVFAQIAAIGLALVIRDWHGNTTRTLLLRLVDDSTKRAAEDEHNA
jgi:hypothetical protein